MRRKENTRVECLNSRVFKKDIVGNQDGWPQPVCFFFFFSFTFMSILVLPKAVLIHVVSLQARETCEKV